MSRESEAREFEQEMNALIEERILEMEQNDYDFGPRFNKADYTITGILFLLSLALIIVGALV